MPKHRTLRDATAAASGATTTSTIVSLWRELQPDSWDATSTAATADQAPSTNGEDSTADVHGISIPSTQEACPAAPAGHVLFSNVVVLKEHAAVLKTLTGVTLAELASACHRTVFCEAVDTLGNLWTSDKPWTVGEAMLQVRPADTVQYSWP